MTVQQNPLHTVTFLLRPKKIYSFSSPRMILLPFWPSQMFSYLSNFTRTLTPKIIYAKFHMFYATEVVGHVNYILNANGLVELGFISNIFPKSDSGHYQFPYITMINYTKIIKIPPPPHF